MIGRIKNIKGGITLIKKLLIVLIAQSITLITIGMIINTAYADLNDGLLAYHPFDGDANDESGNGNDGTVYGATLTEDRFGNPNSAYCFDGNDYIDLGLMNSISGDRYLTVMGWISFNAFVDTGIMSKRNSVSLAIYAYRKLGLYLYNYPDFVIAPFTPVIGQWYHIAGVIDGAILRLYIDGNLIKKGSTMRPVQSTSHSTGIGAGHNSSFNWDYFHNGLIDEVRIYNRALTEIEIQMLAGWPTTISPASPDFGNIGIDCRSIQSFIMESLSDSDLEIGAISITGPTAAEFRIQNDNCSSDVLASSETCTFEVVFEPESSGEKNVILIISFNTPDTKRIEIPLKGRASEVCEGDFDNDGDVDGSDLSILAFDFGRTDCCTPDVILCEGDFYRDCDVDGSDLAVFASDFGRTNCPFCPNR